jgi:hypothetical protein
MAMRRHSFRQPSCEEEGGTSFWAALYATPCCPRCGCQVSRYSEEGLFTDLDPGNDEVIDIQARKLGLSWRDGKLRDPQGQVVSDREILAALFNAGRRAAKSIKAFESCSTRGSAWFSHTLGPTCCWTTSSSWSSGRTRRRRWRRSRGPGR